VAGPGPGPALICEVLLPLGGELRGWTFVRVRPHHRQFRTEPEPEPEPRPGQRSQRPGQRTERPGWPPAVLGRHRQRRRRQGRLPQRSRLLLALGQQRGRHVPGHGAGGRTAVHRAEPARRDDPRPERPRDRPDAQVADPGGVRTAPGLARIRRAATALAGRGGTHLVTVVIAAFAVLAFLVIGGGGGGGGGGGSPAGNPHGGKGSGAERILASRALGLNITVPTGWRSRRRRGVLVLVAPSRRGVLTLARSAPAPARAVVDAAAASVARSYRSTRLVRRGVARLAGRRGVSAELSARKGRGRLLRVLLVGVRTPRGSYPATVTTGARPSRGLLLELEQALRSLRFSPARRSSSR